MSYGIEIINNDNRILVDDTYANFGLKSTTYTTQNLAAGTPPNETITYPNISGALANDLIIARTGTNDNGTLARGFRSTTIVYWEAIIGAKCPSNLDHPDTAVTNILRDMGGLYSPATSGYGLEVYKSNGDVAFTSNISKHFTILATGGFNSADSGTTTISFPSATTSYSDLSNVYVVLNNCLAWELDLGASGYTLSMNGYEYEWTSSTAGRIHIHNLYYRVGYPNPSQNGYFTRDLDMTYLIVREVG
jgi:hypothetical protein